MSGDVGSQDLGKVTPFCKEDNDERGYYPATRNRFAFNNGLLLALSSATLVPVGTRR